MSRLITFALEVHPTEIAFDLYSAEHALEAIGRRPEFGFNFDPSHLIWQGIDPVEFIRAFPDRIYHVQMKDAIVRLNGWMTKPFQGHLTGEIEQCRMTSLLKPDPVKLI